MSEAMTAAIGAAGTAIGVIGSQLVNRYRNRDRLDDAQAGTMIRKLWSQNEKLTQKVDECQRHHQECEVRATRLEAVVENLRSDFDDLRRRVDSSD